MKQNIKRIWLALCMAVCLFALSGCSMGGVEEEIDPSIQMAMQQGAQQYLELFNTMTNDADLESAIATSQKNKDTVMESAFNSWLSVKDDLGAFVSAGTAAVSDTGDGYAAKIDAVYENREMEFTLIVDEDLANVTSVTFNPEYTIGEKMAKAAMNTLMGMGVVFVVLIFISWLIGCFKYINRWEEGLKKKQQEKERAAAPAPAPAPAPAAAPAPAPQAAPVQAEADLTDDTELVAVIAAAIAASEGKPSAEGLVVRSIKRVPNANWKRA